MFAREYIWVASRCECPKLKTDKEYVIMGSLVSNAQTRESRLQLARDSFVRVFNKANDARILKLKAKQDKVCQPEG